MSKSIQLKDKNNEKYYPHPYYPVGSIYLSVNNTNPTRWFGGTWELIAQGRTLVGVDTSDADFNTVKKTGGSKTVSYTPSGTVNSHTLTVDEIPSHRHDSLNWNGSQISLNTLNASGYGLPWNNKSNADSQNFHTGYTGGGKGHNHGFTGTASTINKVQPYFTCYIWCRTA